MTMRPRLLFLSQTLPYPPDGGVKIRTYNTLRLLARVFDVTGLCFYRRRLNPTPAAGIAALRPFGELEVFPIPSEHAQWRLLRDHVRSLTDRRVYTVPTYDSGVFRRRLRQLLRSEDFDLVHADSLDLSGYFPDIGHLPIVCVHHDAQSVLLRRRAKHEVGVLRRWYVGHQAMLMEREEREWCRRVALNVTVSEVDRQELARLAPQAPFAVVPNGVDTNYFTPGDGAEDGVVFVGGATWLPNLDGMEYFCSTILPELRAEVPQLRLRWVGRVDDERRRAFELTYGIELTGYVDDVRSYVRDAACYVVPIRIGGGTRIKILDAWAMGKAVVSTSIGCEGLEAVDGVNILIRDEPLAFAKAVRDVLTDITLRRRLGEAARRTAEQTYDWEVIGRAMNALYLSLLKDHVGVAETEPAPATPPK